MAFIPQDLDFERSPITGVTWHHWVEAGKHLLDGVFRHLPSPDSPLRFPRHETAVSYPQPDHPEWRKRSENFEGVARTLLIAGPLLAHFPELEIQGIALADYYRRQILDLVDPESDRYVGASADVVAVSGEGPYQMTCEYASLAIALHTAPDALWNPFSQAERDRIAEAFSDWGHRQTHPHNWRLFNILILTFLQDQGYEIDQEIYEDHLRCIRSFDVGDGWYRDGTLFDYYSVWAFQFYAPLWAHWVGYETMPEMAAAIEHSSNTLLETYGRLFDRDGRQFMWGRSNIYRFAACAPLGSAFLLKKPGVRPGAARRVMTGNLLQFLSHPDFLVDGLPSLGFYGPFGPLIQPYSCASSPFWFGNGYHAVALGPDHPLWSEREEAGDWADVPPDGTVETELAGPGMVITQYGGSGASEIRTGKVMLPIKSNLLVDYSRLAFHTDLPWQADTAEGLASMRYNLSVAGEQLPPNLMFYAGQRDDVLYRRVVFGFAGPFGHCPSIDLADWVLPEGLVRCDRLRIAAPEAELTLTHYALPLVDGDCRIEQREVAPGVVALIAASGDRQVALVAAQGWNGVRAIREKGLHPDAEESVLLTATSERTARYGGEPLRISVMLHRKGTEPWSDEELWPFRDIRIQAVGPQGSAPYVEFELKDGSVRRIDYSKVEGNLQI